jgi:uncharacterized membrane protein YdjX (TVP38/TMEM64 family)
MEQEKTERKPQTNQLAMRIAIIVFVILLTVSILAFQGEIRRFMNRIPGMGWFAYPAIFAISIVANATIIVPVPGIALTALFGAFFNPIGVAIAAGGGSAIGEITGYMAGYSGSGVVGKSKWSEHLEYWMRKYGGIIILILAVIPNPLFDMAGMIAGVLKMPVYKFLLWCTLGKIIKMLVFAYLGNKILIFIPSFN